ncbi:MAG: hypothetical protein JWN08_2518 [Frankiales bacterium]|nr:hypothetical protein [Frankiales bacterium]
MSRARTSWSSRTSAVTGLLATALAAAVVAALVPAASAQEVPAEPTTTTSPAPGPVASADPAPAPTPSPTGPSPTGPSATSTAVLRLSTSVGRVVAGADVVLTGRATDPAGVPLAGELLDVVSRTGGTTTSVVVGRLTTGADGLGSFTWKPRTTGEYLLRRVARPGSVSDRRVVVLQPRLSAAVAPSTQVTGSAATLRGSLAPAYLGARLQVQRRLADGSWQGVATIGTSSTGVYTHRLVTGALGRHVYRVVLGPRTAHQAAASAPVALNVLPDPTLRQGDRSAAVTVLEQRLVAQRADVGAVDGWFDADLRHGLTAFQKSQGLPRTGLYDLATRRRLADPLPVRLRYPAAGRAVEVDLTKQVLYLSQGGVLQRIVDVSTGNDQPYTSDGVTYRAFTPTGRFTITRKIDGIRVSRLGALYRPAYFVQGWAVHGSPSVPTYPASHGCVRITNSSMDRLFPLLTVGTPVSVFRS